MEFAKLSSPSLKDLFVQQIQGMILSGALEHLAVSRAIQYASDEALDHLGEPLAKMSHAGSDREAAEFAFEFQHELALAGGNSILPLIYSSFKPPVIALWVRFAACTGYLRWFGTPRRFISCFGAGTRRALPTGSTSIWSRPSAGISRFMSCPDAGIKKSVRREPDGFFGIIPAPRRGRRR